MDDPMIIRILRAIGGKASVADLATRMSRDTADVAADMKVLAKRGLVRRTGRAMGAGRSIVYELVKQDDA